VIEVEAPPAGEVITHHVDAAVFVEVVAGCAVTAAV